MGGERNLASRSLLQCKKHRGKGGVRRDEHRGLQRRFAADKRTIQRTTNDRAPTSKKSGCSVRRDIRKRRKKLKRSTSEDWGRNLARVQSRVWREGQSWDRGNFRSSSSGGTKKGTRRRATRTALSTLLRKRLRAPLAKENDLS